MKHEVIIIENTFSKQIDKAILENFTAEIAAVLARDDYEFSGVIELGFFVLFDSDADNTLRTQKQG